MCEKEGRKEITIAGDIGDKDFCDRAVAGTVEKLGGLDILINNAGEQHPDEDITEITEQQLRRTFQTNVFGMFFMTPAARPRRTTKANAVVHCPTLTRYHGSDQLPDYSRTQRPPTALTPPFSNKPIEAVLPLKTS